MQSSAKRIIVGEMPVSTDNWPGSYDSNPSNDHIQFKYVFYFDSRSRICFELQWRTTDTPDGTWSEWDRDFDDPAMGFIPEYIPQVIEMLERMYRARNLG